MRVRLITGVGLMLFTSCSHQNEIEVADIQSETGEISDLGQLSEFENEVELFSEDALVRHPSGMIEFGSNGCEIDDQTRETFDALLPVSAEQAQIAEQTHLPFGLPKRTTASEPTILYHPEYVIGYNTNLRVPAFVSYQLTKENVVAGTRFDCFREDHRLFQDHRSTLIDYEEPVFDRGHLVPVADMLRSQASSVNTFFMSNMMPQSGSLNSGVWKFLEGSTRLWANHQKEILVVSGPIFDKDNDGRRDADGDARFIEPHKRVAEPTHFFRIVLKVCPDNSVKSMAFLIPHNFESIGRSEPYIKKNLASINEIELASGFDFFPSLDEALENEVEFSKAEEIWKRRGNSIHDVCRK